MSTYQIHDGLKSKTKILYQPAVYSEESFLSTKTESELYHFYWVNDNEAHAHVAFSIVANIAYSPHKLPFGGVEVSEHLSIADIQAFMKGVEVRLRELKVENIRIHQAPDAYFDQANINGALSEQEFEVIQNRIFHTISVDSSDLFDRMHKMEQRKIKKCIGAGAEFRELKKSEKVKSFQWIERFRTLDYKPPSMTWVDLRDVNQRNPKLYKVFGVFMDDYMVAATVVVIVNKKAAYHFMPASHVEFQDYRKFSPMVFLVDNLYKWCQANSIQTLDLGTSYVDMKMKTSLAKFKENIGGKPSEALSWQKTLSL